MDDALRMNNDFHPRHLDTKEPMRLDHFEPFIEERGRIDRDLWSHTPGRMFQRLFRCDRGELFAAFREMVRRTRSE